MSDMNSENGFNLRSFVIDSVRARTLELARDSNSVYVFGEKKMALNVMFGMTKDGKPNVGIGIGHMKEPHNKAKGLIRPEELDRACVIWFASSDDVKFFMRMFGKLFDPDFVWGVTSEKPLTLNVVEEAKE